MRYSSFYEEVSTNMDSSQRHNTVALIGRKYYMDRKANRFERSGSALGR